MTRAWLWFLRLLLRRGILLTTADAWWAGYMHAGERAWVWWRFAVVNPAANRPYWARLSFERRLFFFAGDLRAQRAEFESEVVL